MNQTGPVIRFEPGEPGSLYIGGHYYSYDYKLLRQMDERQIYFLVRGRATTQWVVDQEFELSECEPQRNITYSTKVKLGKNGNGPTVHVIEIQTADDKIRLLCNLPGDTMGATEIAALYKERWQIECFFYWIKCILKNRHWFCESPRGMQVQVYVALIAAALLMLFTEKRPNKRCMEVIQLYLNGWCKPEELTALLKKYAK